jgi:hypothetical protein
MTASIAGLAGFVVLGFAGWRARLAASAFSSALAGLLIASRAWLPAWAFHLTVLYALAELAWLPVYFGHVASLDAGVALRQRPDQGPTGQQPDPCPPGYDPQAFFEYVMAQIEFYFQAFGSKMTSAGRAQFYLGPWCVGTHVLHSCVAGSPLDRACPRVRRPVLPPGLTHQRHRPPRGAPPRRAGQGRATPPACVVNFPPSDETV